MTPILADMTDLFACAVYGAVIVAIASWALAAALLGTPRNSPRNRRRQPAGDFAPWRPTPRP